MKSHRLQPGQVAVNLGSGPQIAPGWDNYDNSPNLKLSKIPYAKWILWKIGILSDHHYNAKWPKEIIARELTKPLPYAPGTVDFVYTSHFLEHILLSDVKSMLKEMFRVLKPGGVTRIIVPDLRYYIDEYVRNTTANPAEAGDIFMKAMNVHPKQRDPHLWMYDTPSMMKHLREAGFTQLDICSFKQGRCPDLEILDNRPIDSLFIEATK